MASETGNSVAGPAAPRAMLDGESYKRFEPLLTACDDYARYTGCRFQARSFSSQLGGAISVEGLKNGAEADKQTVECQEEQGWLILAAETPQEEAERSEAVRAAAPVVGEFVERLRQGEPGLLEELDRAFRLVMQEGVRNAMIGTCTEAGVFPPNPRPANIHDQDYTYQDVAAPFEVIAQRLYNDQVRRILTDVSAEFEGELDGLGRQIQRRARTAAFLVDFASEVGVELPETPEVQQAMFQEFSSRAEEWAAARGHEVQVREILLASLRSFGAKERAIREDVLNWWQEKGTLKNTATVFGIAAGGLVVAPVVLPVAAIGTAAVAATSLFTIPAVGGALAVKAVAKRAGYTWAQ